MFEAFYNNPVIQRLAKEKRWTISDKDKVPIDMTDLLTSNGRIIHGALTRKEGHNPFVDLYTLMHNIPNAANNAYSLDAKTDGIMVLDIEPKCPKAIAEKLLQLPAFYGEFSLSGKGYHLILPVPKEYEDVYSCSTAVKEEHGYYEFLCNHCVTFTRNIIPAGYVPNIGQGSYDDFVKLWCDVASKVDLTKRDAVIDVMSEEEDTEWTDYIQTILQSDAKAYKKTPEDFEEDMSRYEHGYTGHVYFVLVNVLKSLRVFYTKSQMIWEVYRATSELIPYRDKHDTIHDRMPWLLYQASVIVGKNYDEDEMHAMTDQREDEENENANSLASMIEDDTDEKESLWKDEFNDEYSVYEGDESESDEYENDESTSVNENEEQEQNEVAEKKAEENVVSNNACENNTDKNKIDEENRNHHFDFEGYEEDSSTYNASYGYYENEE